MGKYFSDVVEKAVADLYYCYDKERAAAAAEALFFAAKEQEDGDACYFLSRCFSGTAYSWLYHPFQENQEAAFSMLRQGILWGSAVAVLGALRMDMLTPELRALMPFSTMREAWEAVYEKAEAGCLFCQYMIGNTYYFLDIIEIDDRKESQFASQAAWDDWRREQMQQSIPWFEKAFAGGMGIAGRNLHNYYQYGRGSLIPPQPEKALEVARQGAELGYPDWMYLLGVKLFDNYNQKEEGLVWARKAAEAGHLMAWSLLGDAYARGIVVERNDSYALKYYEKGAAGGRSVYSSYCAGEYYFCGVGTPVDYARAVQYLGESFALSDEPYKEAHMLGICYLLGYGCQQDMALGRTLLERSQNSRYRNYGLGLMYAEGLGVPQDIERGVEYLKAAGNYGPAEQALKNYKKSFFGVWRRVKK